MEQMHTLDLLPFILIPLHSNLHPVPQPPDMNLKDLNRPLNILFPHLVRPPIHIANITQLTRDANTMPESHAHPPLRKSQQGILLLPPFLTDKV
jgi:hypothetical protein